MKQVKVILGRFQPFTLGHLTIATLSKLNGPDAEQKDKLREQPDLKEIEKQKTIILAVSTPKEKVDARHPFEDVIMKKEFEIIKKNYKEIEDVLYVKSADICAWGEMLKQKGYQASVWITGTDEFAFYKGMGIKVPEYEEHNRDNRDFKDACSKSFYVEEVKRAEGSENFIETISGTKVREALKNDDKDIFTKMMPKGVDKLYDEFREAVLNAPEPKPKKTKKIKEYMNMKSLTKYLFENLSGQEFVQLLKDIKVDFSEVSSMPSKTPKERFNKAKAQEQIFIDALKNSIDDPTIEILSIEEWCKKTNKNYSPKVDSENGDIIILKDGKEVTFIDLKVNLEKDEFVGAPSILSIVNFKGNPKHVYFLCNTKCTKKYLINPDKLYNLLIERKGFLVMTKERNRTMESYPEVKKLVGQITVKKPNNAPNSDNWKDDFLHNEDFVGTSVIENNYKKIVKWQ